MVDHRAGPVGKPTQQGVVKPTLQDIDTYTDTRDYLRHSREHAETHGYIDWTIVDMDAHHVESISWKEIVRFIDDPVLRDQALAAGRSGRLNNC